MVAVPHGKVTMPEQVKEKVEQQGGSPVVAREASVEPLEPQRQHKWEVLLRKSAEYLDIVSVGKRLDPEDKNYIVKHTLENFDEYFNRGFLHYRKSVAEAEDFAAIRSILAQAVHE